jgi:hypothetical protein
MIRSSTSVPAALISSDVRHPIRLEKKNIKTFDKKRPTPTMIEAGSSGESEADDPRRQSILFRQD